LRIEDSGSRMEDRVHGGLDFPLHLLASIPILDPLSSILYPQSSILYPSGNCQVSYSSGSAESNRHFPGVDDSWDFSPAFRMLKHLFELVRVGFHVDILNCITALAVILTGGRGVRSPFLAVNYNDSIAHSLPPFQNQSASSL
jgi:hypothetical protein